MERFYNAVSQAKRSLREVHKNPKLISFFFFLSHVQVFCVQCIHACMPHTEYLYINSQPNRGSKSMCSLSCMHNVHSYITRLLSIYRSVLVVILTQSDISSGGIVYTQGESIRSRNEEIERRKEWKIRFWYGNTYTEYIHACMPPFPLALTWLHCFLAFFFFAVHNFPL